MLPPVHRRYWTFNPCCVVCTPVHPDGMADKQLFEAVANGDTNYLAALLSRKKEGLNSKNKVRMAVLACVHESHDGGVYMPSYL